MGFFLLLLHRIINITFLLSVVRRRKEFSGEILFEVKSCLKLLNLLEMLILILFSYLWIQNKQKSNKKRWLFWLKKLQQLRDKIDK